VNTEITDNLNESDANAFVALNRGRSTWLAAMAPPALAIALRPNLPNWLWMWVLSLSLFLSAKWITILPILFSRERVPPGRLLAYALLWPGMDAHAFCRQSSVSRPATNEWLVAGAKALFGAALLWSGGCLIGASHPLVTGWTGMVGVVLFLHFGLFHLISLSWRALGIQAGPIMQSPAAANSLSQFWGRRWNVAFSRLVHEYAFKPLTRHLGARRALFATFLISGAVHDLVISVPAHGGYGLPTIYFVIQGLGVLFEHSQPGRKLGIASGWKGWCFTALVTATPASLLFPPVFVHNVILPMLRVIHAT
jgi:alginate O-acetyltransferase complex protein AlgI